MYEILFVIIISLVALVAAGLFALQVLRYKTGSAKMQEVAAAIREGAEAFLKRQYTTIAIMTVIAALLLFGVYFLIGKPDYAWHTAVAFLFGASLTHLQESSACGSRSGQI